MAIGRRKPLDDQAGTVQTVPMAPPGKGLPDELLHRSHDEERAAAEEAARAALAREEQEIATAIIVEEQKVEADMQVAQQAAAYATEVAPGSEAAQRAKQAMKRVEEDERRIIEDYNAAIQAAEDAASSRRLGDAVEAEREIRLAEHYKEDAAKAFADAEAARLAAERAAQDAYLAAQQAYQGSSGTGGPAEAPGQGS